MLKLMFKWTNNFEKDKIELEEKINQYSNKLVILKNVKEINSYKID